MKLAYLPKAYINETSPIDTPCARYCGIPICLIGREYPREYGAETLKELGLKEVYQDPMRLEVWYVKGNLLAAIAKLILKGDKWYYKYFLRDFLCKTLRLINKPAWEEFSWRRHFVLFQKLQKLIELLE